MDKNKWGGLRVGSGRIPLAQNEKKIGVKIYITQTLKAKIEQYGTGNNFSSKAVDLIEDSIKDKISKGDRYEQ